MLKPIAIALGIMLAPAMVGEYSAANANSVPTVQTVNDKRGGFERHERVRHGYSPHEVRRILRHQGYRHVRIVDQHRGAYVAIAQGRRGTVKLLVSSRNGDVLERRLLRPTPYRTYRKHNVKPRYSFELRF